MDWNPNDAVVIDAVRTPFGRARRGSLVAERPDDLSAHVAKALLERVGSVELSDVEDLYWGCAEPHDEHGQNIARRIAVLLGADNLPGATVNRFCASSLQAIRMAHHAIRADEGETFLVGGAESISRYADLDEARNPVFDARKERLEHLERWQDPRETGELPDVYIGMGLTAEFVAQVTQTSRAEQDLFALGSHQKAMAAQAAGHLARDIIPVHSTQSGATLDADESIRPNTSREGLAALAPVFREDGTVTAGNACPLNDGASAALIMSHREAERRGFRSRGRILSTAVSALSPEIMGLGPVESSRRALSRAGLTIDDIDVMEINEAFAAQVLPSVAQIGVPLHKVNPLGGAIAIGHPYGATGVRLVSSALTALEVHGGRYALVTLCVGGGQGMAMILEANTEER